MKKLKILLSVIFGLILSAGSVTSVLIPEQNFSDRENREQVQENVESLSIFLNDAAEQYGQGHVCCMMIPSKTEALPDKLPRYAEPADTNGVLAALKDSLEQPDCLLYAGEFLEKHRNDYIYYRTDHHWTTLGAYYAWNGWAEKMGLPGRDMEDFKQETIFRDFYGTTYNKAQIHVKPDSVDLFHCPAEDGVHVEMDDGNRRQTVSISRRRQRKDSTGIMCFSGEIHLKLL